MTQTLRENDANTPREWRKRYSRASFSPFEAFILPVWSLHSTRFEGFKLPLRSDSADSGSELADYLIELAIYLKELSNYLSELENSGIHFFKKSVTKK